MLSPHDPNTLYVAGNVLFRTRDEGASWEVISPDLTRNDQEKIAGAPLGMQAGGETQGNHYCTISSIAESPHTPGILWTGSDDGLIHVTRDNGATWTNVTPPGLPAWALTQVKPSPHDPAVAYVAASNHGLDDFRPYLYRTRDYGASWESITDGIPVDEFVRVVREDPVQPGLLYAGTEVGVHVSLDDGRLWRQLRLNLPVVAIYDLIVKESDLIVGTHGRGMWILDDVTPLREAASGALDSRLHLFRPSPVTRLTRHVYGMDSLLALYHTWAADNPPSGVVLYYLLGTPASRVTISLSDATGTVVNTFDSEREPRRPAPIGPMVYHLRGGVASLTGTVAGEEEPGIRWGARTLDRGADPRQLPVEAGLHRVALDITYPGARPVPGALRRGITAPVAPPGVYTVRLTADDEVREHQVEILPDPRSTTTPQEYRAQFDLMLRIRDKVSEVHDTVNLVRDLREQLEARTARLGNGPAWASATESAASILERIGQVEGALIQPGLHQRSGELDAIHFPLRLNHKLEALGYHVARSDDPPTTQDYALFDDLAGRADRQLARLRQVLEEDVPAFNRAMQEAAVPAVIIASPPRS